LLDAAGNRELIFRDPRISSTSPIPLAPRRVPPVLSPTLATEPSAAGEMIIMDIYQGLDDIPRGTIRQLRVIQILPKTTWLANQPLIGFAGEENARAILGTVPVEPDGSARFLVPAHKPVLFQALDQEGFAVQTMRSSTCVQPGERTACVGCHEHRMSAPKTAGVPLAMRRTPSTLDPGELGGEPFSFVRFVQPVLDRHCVRCHGGEKTEKDVNLTGAPHEGFTKSYWALCGRPGDFDDARTNPEQAAAALVPRFGQRNQIQTTPPGGRYGALGSRLIKMLRAGHQGVQLTDGDQRRLAAWVDCNAVFHGTYDPAGQARQLSGQPLPMPAIQ
jgi:cytochrome c553